MKKLLSLVFSTVLSIGISAHADSLILDPQKTSCKVELNQLGQYMTNVYYEGVRIHDGREANQTMANGDFLKCKSIVATAMNEAKSIVMSRDNDPYDNFPGSWGDAWFFKISLKSKCDY